MADLSATFMEVLEHLGYWLIHTLLYVTALAVIWFVFALPVIREKKYAGTRYERFVYVLFVTLVGLTAIASLASLAEYGIIPFSAIFG